MYLDLCRLTCKSPISAFFSLMSILVFVCSTSSSNFTRLKSFSVYWRCSSCCCISVSATFSFALCTYFVDDEGKAPPTICGANTCLCPLWKVCAMVPEPTLPHLLLLPWLPWLSLSLSCFLLGEGIGACEGDNGGESGCHDDGMVWTFWVEAWVKMGLAMNVLHAMLSSLRW